MNLPTPDPSQEGSRHSSAPRKFPSWEGLGVGSWCQCTRKNERRLCMNLLEVHNLKVHFPVRPGLFSRTKEFVRAVDDVSFSIAPGETVGLVGESGCGKTTLGRAVVRLIEPTSGRILFEGQDIAVLTGSKLRAWRRKFQMIFQDPYGSLDPHMTVAAIIGEALDIHKLTPDPSLRRQRI